MVYFHNLSPDAVVETIPCCRKDDKVREPVVAGEYWEKKFYSAYY